MYYVEHPEYYIEKAVCYSEKSGAHAAKTMSGLRAPATDAASSLTRVPAINHYLRKPTMESLYTILYI